MNPLISIVIPCYNDADFIEQAVNSALNQTYSNKEIILIDDGSDEKTKAVLKSIEPKIDLLLVQDNRGQSNARNNGIDAARGEYILVLDSDDYFEPEFCNEASRLISMNPEIKIISCWFRRIQNSKVIDVFKPGGGDIVNFLQYNQAPGSVIFRKVDWERVNGYDESMRKGFEDWDFYIRLIQEEGIAHIIPKVMFNYRMRPNSTTSKANKIKYDLLRELYLKHKTLYCKYYDSTINHFLERIKREESEKIKNMQRLEFVLGHYLLSPIRVVKRLVKIGKS
ncbi:glycosyltransferase [Flavobacteriaceae bacterium]|nr:glycosyltransferase [Flavobacteriaceae bacterium]